MLQSLFAPLMRYQPFALVGVAAMLLTFAFSGCEQARAIRIMPLGDSITNGTGSKSGYRSKLYADLTAAGYEIDFLGSQQTNPSPELPDLDHEGHPGFNIDNILNGWKNHPGVNVWLGSAGYDPDIILLLIGGNDVGEQRDFEHAPDRLDALITRICDTKTGLKPKAHVIISRITPRAAKPNDHNTRWYNEQLDIVVARHIAAGEKITKVDCYQPLNPADLADGVHPTQAGYDKIAEVWFDAIMGILRRLGAAWHPGIRRLPEWRFRDMMVVRVRQFRRFASGGIGGRKACIGPLEVRTDA